MCTSRALRLPSGCGMEVTPTKEPCLISASVALTAILRASIQFAAVNEALWLGRYIIHRAFVSTHLIERGAFVKGREGSMYRALGASAFVAIALVQDAAAQ